MRLVIAECQVDYAGRLAAHLPPARRLVLMKADGSVSIHADDRAYKPLMWMSPPCWTVTEQDTWTVTNRDGEQLVISLLEVFSDSSHTLGVDPGLVKDGVEAHLQVLLAEHVSALGAGVPPGAAGVPHRHRSGRPVVPGSRRGERGRGDQAAR